MNDNIEKVIEEIFELISSSSEADYIGEAITQLEHFCQTAEFAEQQGNSDEVILGAFFHDIGHICTQITEENDMDGYGNLEHDVVGANYLRDRGFSEKVARLVESHVEAKRYLCATWAEYMVKLSSASAKTLEFQGGPMDEEEVQKFEADPFFKDILKVRAWDELAKVENKPLPEMNHYKEITRRHLLDQSIKQ
jgi:phosphonate degradation associated HDIG domain protein